MGYLALGILCVGLGFVGYVTPVMPGTVFFIIALWAFKRSSPRLETWLLTRSPVAEVLSDWDRERTMRRRTKILAVVMVWVGIGFSILVLVRKRAGEWRLVLSGISSMENHRVLLVPPLLLLTAILLTIYISTRKTKQTLTIKELESLAFTLEESEGFAPTKPPPGT